MQRSRALTAPFVLTFATALGCGGRTSNPPAPPLDATSEAETSTPTDESPSAESEPAESEPAEPEPAAPPPELEHYEPTQTTEVIRNDDGSCVEAVIVDCPPSMACNPPRPKPVECTEDAKTWEQASAELEERREERRMQRREAAEQAAASGAAE